MQLLTYGLDVSSEYSGLLGEHEAMSRLVADIDKMVNLAGMGQPCPFRFTSTCDIAENPTKFAKCVSETVYDSQVCRFKAVADSLTVAGQ